MKIIGIDAATWRIIKPNIEKLPNFKKLMQKCGSQTITVQETPKSAPLWTSIFTGLTQAEHKHKDFVVDEQLQKREDIEADFVWEKLEINSKVLQVPAVIPPINWNTEYKPEGYGISSDLEELESDRKKLLEKSKEVIKEDPELFVTVFMQLDRVSHFYWDDKELILEWYKKMDEVLGELLEFYDFESDEPLIILSDHGFAEFGEADVQTLPEETPHGKLQGDHHEEAILITKNVNYEIKQPEDVGKYILHYYTKD